MRRTVPRSRGPSGGFTLIELLVAVAIFAVLAAFAYGALGRTLASAEFLGARAERLDAVQRTVRFLTLDFQQLAPRPVREQLGDVTAQGADPVAVWLFGGIGGLFFVLGLVGVVGTTVLRRGM